MKSKAKRPEAKAGKNKVLVNFILDKSGSMSIVQKETIEGFNKYIAELKTEKAVDYTFSLTMFDTEFNVIHTAVPLGDVEDLDTTSYAPGGMTALYDAIGVTIRGVEKDAKKVDKVVTVIYTDGEENSSREFSHDQIQALIKQKEALGNWTVVYLGATMHAVAIGQNIGVSARNSYKYQPKHTVAVYASLARSTNSLSAGIHGQSMCFVAPEDQGAGISGVDDQGAGLPGNSGLSGTFIPDTSTVPKKNKSWKDRIDMATSKI